MLAGLKLELLHHLDLALLSRAGFLPLCRCCLQQAHTSACMYTITLLFVLFIVTIPLNSSSSCSSV